MTIVTEKRCDRCGIVISPLESHITMTVNYHHSKKLDICRRCEGAFTLFLGKHPLFGTSLSTILSGRAAGDGYPSARQIELYERIQGMDKL